MKRVDAFWKPRIHKLAGAALILWGVALFMPPMMHSAAGQGTAYRFDFGAATSEAGYVVVDNTMTYMAARGYGWLATTGLLLRDRTAPDDLRRDFVFSTSGAQTFRVTGLAPGRYLMKVLCGDLSYGDHVITVSVPNAGTLPTISPRTGEFLMLSATVNTTGTLDITFGSPTSNWVVNALTLEPTTTDITPVIESANLSEWDAAVFTTDPTPALLDAFSENATGDIRATGLTRANYLNFAAGEVDFWKAKQNSSGAIIDPYLNSEWQYSTPAFAHAAAALVAYGNRTDLLEPASKAMDWATARLHDRLAANGHEDFYPPMLAHALMLLKPYAAAARVATWENNLSTYDPYAIYRQAIGSMNWNIVSSSGEALFRKLGLRSASNFYVEESFGAQGRHFTSPFGLYLEGPMAYDHFPRIFLADVLAQGYTGLYSSELNVALDRAAITSLFMQSPWGELPAGGRSAHHQWNEAEQCVTYEIYAAKAKTAGDTRTACVYKRAAHLALSSMLRWVRPTGEMQIVKNWVNPASRHGYESYSAHSQYNLLPTAMLALAFEYAAATEDVSESPAPADTGGFVFEVPELHKVFANAGGNYVEIDTSGDHHYDATGLIRVHNRGVLPQLGPSDSLLTGASYNSPNPSSITTGVGASWQDSGGVWHTLGEMGSAEITSVTVTPSLQTPSRVAFDVTYAGSMAGVNSLTEHYVITPDGVQLTTELSGYSGALRYVWPVLSNDGKTASTINVSSNTVSVSQGGTAQTFTAPGAQSVRVETAAYSNHNGWARLGVAEYPSGGKITLLISSNVLFSDTFNRSDNATVGMNDNGLGGTLTATYTEKETASIASNQLLLNGSSAQVTPGINFVHNAITSGGFMDIEFDCNPVSNTATNSSGWVGVTIGQSGAPSGMAVNTTGTGKDFSLLLRDNGYFQALSTGANVVAPDTVFDSAPSATEPEAYHVKVRVTTNSFAAGAPFTVSATVTGELDSTPGEDTLTLDLNGAAAGTDYAGVWTGSGNYITLESNAISTIDNLKISALTGSNSAYWKGDVDGNWSTNTGGNTNWAASAAGTTDAGKLPDATTDVIFAATAASNLANAVLGADISIRSLTVTSAAAVGIGGTQNLTLCVGGLTVEAGAGATTVNTTGQVILGASQTWSNLSTNTLTVSSSISGSGFGLTIEGSGAIALLGANTYSGPTILNAGTLVVNGGISGGGAFTTANGTVLTGAGSIAGSATINGIHSPGNNVGTQAFGAALTYGSTARLKWELGSNSVTTGAFDRVTAAGTVSITSGAMVDPVFNGAGSTVAFNDAFWSQSRSWTIVTGSSVTGAFALSSASVDSGGRTVSNYGTFALQYSGTAVTLVFTPYPPQQVWQRLNFGANWNNAAIAGDLVDGDKDSLPNLLEYGLASDPNVTSAGAAPQAGMANGKLTITFTRNAAATDVTLRVLGADSPSGPWTELARSTAGAAFTVIASGATVNESGTGATRSVQVGDIYPAGDPVHPTRFLRLRVEH